MSESNSDATTSQPPNRVTKELTEREGERERLAETVLLMDGLQLDHV